MSGSSNKIAARAAIYAVERLNAGSKSEWRTKRSNPCPVCQHGDWCRVDPEGRVALCMRDSSGEPFGQVGDYLHVLDPQYFDAQAGEWQAPEPKPRPPKPLPLGAQERQRRHDAYQALLGLMPSAEGHEQLAPLLAAYPAAARLLGARLMPARGSRQADAILKALRESGQSFAGVPGFGGRGKTTAAFPVACEAIAFPTFASDGLIEGLHLRLLGSSGSKYIWFSGDEFGGVPRDAANDALPVSIYRSEGSADAPAIVITEGEKKAACAADAFGCVAISVPGVTQWRAALGALRSIDPAGESVIRLAWDMDQDDNEHVARALESFAQALEGERRRIETGRWAQEHKGLDDALIASGPKLIEWTPRGAEVAQRDAAELVIDGEPEEEEERPWWIAEFHHGAREYYTEDDGSLYEIQPPNKGLQAPPVLVASFVYRLARVIGSAEEAESLTLLEIRHEGRTLEMEVPGSARAGRKLAEMLAGRIANYHVSDSRPNGANVLSLLARNVYKEHPPEIIIRHRPGFNKAFDAYRVPGWRFDGDGFHEEPAEVCPAGFGAYGDEFPVPDLSGESLRRAAQAYAENWGALLSSREDLTIALAATLAGGPIAALANSSVNPIIAFVGPTGCGKTTLLNRLRALHGQIEAEPINADNTTIAGAIGLAEQNRDSFALIDDLKEGAKVHKFVSAAFGTAPSLSLTRERDLRVGSSLRGCFALTAEDLAGARQSTINRMVSVRFAKRAPRDVEAADAAVSNLEDLERENGTSCLAAEAIRRCLALREKLVAAMREMQATASRKFDGVARGKKIAGLVGVAVRVVGDMFAELLGELPAWFASPERCMARVVSSHAAAEAEYKPATIIVERFNAARASGDEIVVEEASWRRFGASINVEADQIEGHRIQRDQVRCWWVDGAEHERCLAVEPHKFLAALGLDGQLTERLAHDSLKAEGLLVDVGWKHAGSPQISVYRDVTIRDRGGLKLDEERQKSRPRLWLIKLSPDDDAFPGRGEAVGDDDAFPGRGEAVGDDDACAVDLSLSPAPRPQTNGHGSTNGHCANGQVFQPEAWSAPKKGREPGRGTFSRRAGP